MRFRLTNKALGDLKGIGGIHAEDLGDRAAKRISAAIGPVISPDCGQPEERQELRSYQDDYQSHPVGRHLVFYRVEEGSVTIVRVLHQSMDVEPRLGHPHPWD